MKLVKLLASPILVAKSKSHADRVIVITDRTLRTGDYLAVIIETAQDGENIASVVSINPREQNNIIKWINEGLVIRQDIKKSQLFLQSAEGLIPSDTLRRAGSVLKHTPDEATVNGHVGFAQRRSDDIQKDIDKIERQISDGRAQGKAPAQPLLAQLAELRVDRDDSIPGASESEEQFQKQQEQLIADGLNALEQSRQDKLSSVESSTFEPDGRIVKLIKGLKEVSVVRCLTTGYKLGEPPACAIAILDVRPEGVARQSALRGTGCMDLIDLIDLIDLRSICSN